MRNIDDKGLLDHIAWMIEKTKDKINTTIENYKKESVQEYSIILSF